MNFILFIVAVFLFAIFGTFGFVIALLSLWTGGFKRYGRYFRNIALSIDQMGNVVCAPLFNVIMIRRWGYKFGNIDETISSVLGKNKKLGTLFLFGRLLDKLLNALDENHSINSIEVDP
ncbi:hypothetical protein [uncultured Draconibacterium sp.]|uniref:hypothetical protein n=1 Tax=uncultured Draconibacterium sp. TaxID=1573823 RepID=UPI0025E66101|nr:hypothetical protein [uncultured Draconibacterium sp.]